MQDIYQLIEKAKDDAKALEELIQLFEPKIRTSITKTKINDQEDLAQELRIMLIEYVGRYNLNNVPGFWEMLDREDE